MEVASQHCDTVPNKIKDILDTVNIEKIFIHDSRVQHPVQSSVHGMLNYFNNLNAHQQPTLSTPQRFNEMSLRRFSESPPHFSHDFILKRKNKM